MPMSISRDGDFASLQFFVVKAEKPELQGSFFVVLCIRDQITPKKWVDQYPRLVPKSSHTSEVSNFISDCFSNLCKLEGGKTRIGVKCFAFLTVVNTKSTSLIEQLKELRHGLLLLKSLASILQNRRLQSVLIFSILSHPCSFMVNHQPFGVLLSI